MVRTLPNCQLLEQIYESANSIVYRGQRENDCQPVILKILKEDYPTAAELTRYRQEYEITKSLEIDGVIKVYGIEPYQRTLAILLEDFGGGSLKEHFLGQPVSVPQFLDLASRIVKILNNIHSCRIIHKDINPSNILLNPETGELKIIDFGISTRLGRESPTLKNPSVLEGTLAYISPEQTGRMNRALDYRTDFYSLGVTFYELLTGRLPFPSTDALELVHCHIAQQVAPPHRINPAIPEALSKMVVKLMAKMAEDRYQTAFGIQIDLDHCRRQLEQSGQILPFALGMRDRAEQFCIPQKLYGRAAEIQALLTAFERVSHPDSPHPPELMLVAGFSGIGKSSLVAEVHKPMTEKKGYFIGGKYDQFQRDVPYSAFINAFQDLVKQLLTENEAQLEQWRDRLLTALGPNGQVVIDVIPDVELITGPQPPVSELGPTEAQNRFNLVFQNFIRVFCAPQHPLILFLDDLQWIDSASLKLLKLMLLDQQMQSLLVIGAYRDNEVSQTHPLTSLVAQLEAELVVVETMTLRPLDHITLTRLIGDTVNQDAAQTTSLAQLILQKTEGNPFFVNEFLKSLHAEGLLRFSPQAQHWDWNIEEIRARDLTDSVIELLLVKLKKLPQDTQEVMQLGACVGARFDLTTLSIICQRSRTSIFHELTIAIQLGLIVARSPLNEELVIEEFRFGHDRIQQASYALIDREQKLDVHLKIGRLLWHNIQPEELSERIFEIVDHLNQAEALLTDISERDQIAALNLQAGKKAKSSTAYDAAVRYLQMGLTLIHGREQDKAGWERCYELCLDLHQEAVEAAYLNHQFELQESLTERVLQNTAHVLDRLKVYRVQILARSGQNRHIEATDIGFEVLNQLGISFPAVTPEYLEQVLEDTRKMRGDRSILGLINQPTMAAEDKLAAMQILSDILSSGYQASFERFILSNLTQIQLSLNHGNTSESAFAYDCYGITLCGVVQDIDAGYEFGRLALDVVEKFHARSTQSRVVFVFNAFVRHWKDPLQDTIADLHQGHQIGVETGDLEYASYSLCWEAMHSLLTGQPFGTLVPKLAESSQKIAEYQQSACLLYVKIYQQIVANLQGQAEHPSRLDGEFLTESDVTVDSADNKLALAFFHTLKTFLCYFLGDYTEAMASASLAKDYADGMTAAATVSTLNFYESLTCLAIADPDSEPLLTTVAQNQRQLQEWARFSPANCSHRYELVEAERYRIAGDVVQAGIAYDRAIALAKQHRYFHEEALASELAGQFYLAQEREVFARAYLGEAYYGYFHWGADAKVRQMEQRYPQLVGQSAALAKQATSLKANTRTDVTSASNTSTYKSGQVLDLAAVLQASQAIAGEIVLEKLLTKLLQILIRSAGAQLGHLLLMGPKGLRIEATHRVQQASTDVLQSRPIEGQVPQAVINFVQRTQDSVILRNASASDNFAQDPYIQKHQTRSMLCFPLLNQGQLTAILYLENNLTEGAFTPDRQEILQLLSGQAAIAIEQARTYSKLEQMVDARTRQLEAQKQQLSEAYQELQQTHEELKQTQDGLIQSEKMAALGQLIAGIAHEINTPLGAIRSSVEYTAGFLTDHLPTLSQFFRALSSAEAQQFSVLLERALQQQDTLSGRERRRTRKALTAQLQEKQVPDAEAIASLLTDLGITDGLDSLHSGLADANAVPLLKMVRQLTQVHKSTRDIISASDRASKITFALKTYARYDHSGELLTADITDGLEAVLTLYQNQTKHGITVTRNFAPVPNIACYFDELNQVWTNLIHNSIQAMEQSGELTVGIYQKHDHIQVEIGDTGGGIPHEIQTKIFDPFFTTKPPGEGSGLGLDIVKKIIAKHQGTIDFRSRPGQTVFTVKIPLAPTSLSELTTSHG
ncbi:MAG: AAA family ATPase [Cyanobacteria bacterium P01_F01_bin.42]